MKSTAKWTTARAIGAARDVAAATAAFALCLLAGGPAGAQVQVSQQPLLGVTPPPPNIVFTIDDSGSMAWAYAPDSVGHYNETAAFTSNSYNPLYYNPNTSYNIPPNANGNPVSSPTFSKAYYDGFNTDMGSVDLSCGYTPTLAYQPGTAGPSAPCSAGTGGGGGGPPAGGGGGGGFQSATGNYGPAYYYLFNNGPGCPSPNPAQAPPPDSCFTYVQVSTTSGPGGTDETQNFAIWYSFYRTRHLSIITAAAEAMQNKGLQSARVAWQALNSCADNFTGTNCFGFRGGNTSFQDQISYFSGQHQTDFYSWIFQLPAAQTTPTRDAWWRAGQYYTTKGPNSPYGSNPNPTLSTNASAQATSDLLCVNNFNITLTDGLWNTYAETQNNFCGGQVCGNTDSTATTFPDGTTYTPSYTSGSTTIYGDGNPAAGGGDYALGRNDTGGLADIAFYYWSTNLRPDLTKFYTPAYYPYPGTNNPTNGDTTDATWPYWNSLNDPATWPHMVNFAVGVGLGGFLDVPGLVWSGDAHDSTTGSAYMNLLTAASACGTSANQPCYWPPVDPNASGGGFTGSSAGGGNVYDLWHAAINSRGNFFSAASSQDIVNDMSQIMARIQGQSSGNSAAAGSSSSLSASQSTNLYVASYADLGSDWYGVVTAFAVNSNGAVAATPLWTTTASSIAAAAQRKVLSSSAALPGTSAGMTSTAGIAVSYVSGSNASASGLPPDLLADLGDTPLAQSQIVDYLLGDPAKEQRNGGVFRSRPITVLGDIIDSNPVYTYTEAFNYLVLQPEGATYGTFLGTKSSRLPMVYAGANDGMVHGFNATTGNEVFAYMPHTVYPNLAYEGCGTATGCASSPIVKNLASINYTHAFYVDGPVFVGDAYFGDIANNNPTWRTVLVGTTGAGGPGVYAIDISDPKAVSAANVLWDLDGNASQVGVASNDVVADCGNNGGTNTCTTDPNLGDTIGRPIIARLNDGNWAVVFGNGYASPRGCAVLYVVRLYDGAVQTIDTSGASQGTTTACSGANANNGLGSPTLVDVDGNGTTDFVYAGDLHGNLWKFDLTSSTASAWGVATFGSAGGTPQPFFTAMTAGNVAQPIVTAPNLGPSPVNASAYILYFVTGHMFANGDPTNTTTQSLYAVQDSGLPVKGSRTTLVKQVAIQATDGSGNEDIRQPYPTVDLTVNNGWYIDFPNTGERALATPLLDNGVLLTATVIPSQQPCNGTCQGFIYAVNQFNGNGGLNFLKDPANNTAYDGLADTVGCVSGLTLIANGTTLEWYASGSSPANASSSAGSGGSAGGATGSGGPGNTGTGVGNNGGTAPCPTCIQQGGGTLSVPGRISWHEVIQP